MQDVNARPFMIDIVQYVTTRRIAHELSRLLCYGYEGLDSLIVYKPHSYLLLLKNVNYLTSTLCPEKNGVCVLPTSLKICCCVLCCVMCHNMSIPVGMNVSQM